MQQFGKDSPMSMSNRSTANCRVAQQLSVRIIPFHWKNFQSRRQLPVTSLLAQSSAAVRVITCCPAFLQASPRSPTGSAPSDPGLVNFFVMMTILPLSIEVCSTGKLKQKPTCNSLSGDLNQKYRIQECTAPLHGRTHRFFVHRAIDH